MKRQPLATTEVLKHFVFVLTPSEELSLLEEKRELEAEELSTALGAVKVESEQVVLLTLAGLQMGGESGSTTAWPKIEYGVGCPQLISDPSWRP